jgi:hypothetical protein
MHNNIEVIVNNSKVIVNNSTNSKFNQSKNVIINKKYLIRILIVIASINLQLLLLIKITIYLILKN